MAREMTASQMGRKGGRTKGASKVRGDAEHYRTLAAGSAQIRSLLRLIRGAKHALEPDARYDALCGDWPQHEQPLVHVRLKSASDGGLLLGVYQWARLGADGRPGKYRSL